MYAKNANRPTHVDSFFLSPTKSCCLRESTQELDTRIVVFNTLPDRHAI